MSASKRLAPASETPYGLDHVWPIKKSQAYFTLAVIALLGLLDFVDRQVMAALFPYLKDAYELSDTQLGMLVSVVNISMAVFVIPTAYIVDRWSRKKMIAIMAGVWSLATGACAVAGTYGHLLAARFVIGTGEAGYNPAGQSLLAASFPASLRTTVIAVMQGAIQLGAPLGLFVGAIIAEHWGWRHAFGVVAVPGLLLAVAALFIKDFANAPKARRAEPADGNAERAELPHPEQETRESYWRGVLNLLSSPSFICIILAQSPFILVLGTLMNWLPSYYIREAGMSATAASSYSAFFLLFSGIAVMTAGPVLDAVRRKSRTHGNILVLCAMFVGCALCVWSFQGCAPGSATQMLFLILHSFLVNMCGPNNFTLTADLTPSHQRATAVGLLVTSLNVFGYALGPLLTGIISDHFNLSVGLTVISLLYAVSGLVYIVITLRYPRDLARVKQEKLQF